MANARFVTKELSKRTWPDYVRFFSQGNGWDHCGCTAYQGFRAPASVKKWTDKRDWNLNVKCDLVERGLAHGILVYADGEPVGWCQFGPHSELPIAKEGRNVRMKVGGMPWRADPPDAKPLWRITCFCTRKDFAERGVASVALRAALASIRKRGGGVVEAYPVAVAPADDERVIGLRVWRRELNRLITRHGRFSEEVERHLATPPPPPGVTVEGVGEVNGSTWLYGFMHAGTTSMFEREGFTGVSAIGTGPRVVVRKTVRRSG